MGKHVSSKLLLSRKGRKTLHKLLSREIPNFIELFRWDIIDKEFNALISKKIGVVNPPKDHKG